MMVRMPFLVAVFVFVFPCMVWFCWEVFHGTWYGGDNEQVSAAIGMTILARGACEGYYTRQGHLPLGSRDNRLPEDLVGVGRAVEEGESKTLLIDPFDRSGSPLYATTISWGRRARDKESIHVKGLPVRYYVLSPTSFLVVGNGPDKDRDLDEGVVSKGKLDRGRLEVMYGYDPSNGTKSGGDIMKFGKVGPDR